MIRGKVTSLTGGPWVEFVGFPGDSVGPLDAVASVGSLAIGQRVLVADLGGGDYVIVGRLP